ncbi:DUF4105 domain-containing protein [Myxococcota bacterium]|nr:DUF4105 domain-containing protein [Myxococcota bacterium]MBU1380856.1 DUF4105 domain-containing protein [Myxococcota bacterium]MBU1499153.1 DUF4105 domain-containing protein [Myxococcota bacterium]
MSYIFSLLFLITSTTSTDSKSGNYQTWVLIVAPGPDVFSRFGHSAFMIETPSGKKVYDFGYFNMNSKFIKDFAFGRAFYSLDSRSFDAFLDSYSSEKRTIRGHLLNLTPEMGKQLYEVLESLHSSDGKHYLYDHFRDNCATRLRDLISKVTQGNLQYELEKMKIGSWRTNLDRILGNSWDIKYGLRLVLSSVMDEKRSGWDGAYLPLLLEEVLLKVKLAVNPFGKHEKLIVKSTVFFEGINHNINTSLPIWIYPILLMALFFLISPFIYRDDIIFLKIELFFFSWTLFILFVVMLFLHFYHSICVYNLNIFAFTPVLYTVLPWILFRSKKGRIIGKFIIISMFFPLITIIIRPFTIQKTFPFPDIILLSYIIFYIQWSLYMRTSSQTENQDPPDVTTDSSGSETKTSSVPETDEENHGS